MSESSVWTTRTIAIVSTLRDMEAERRHLREVVFPELRKRLAAASQRLEVIYITLDGPADAEQEGAVREELLLEISLAEIERCRPILVGLLGDRYGRMLLEDSADAATAQDGQELPKSRRSAIELLVRVAVLENANQASRSRFYFRRELPYDQMPPEVAALFSDRCGDDFDRQEGADLLLALKERIRAGLPGRVREYPVAAASRGILAPVSWGLQVLDDLWSDLGQGLDTSTPDALDHAREAMLIQDLLHQRGDSHVVAGDLFSALEVYAHAAELVNGLLSANKEDVWCQRQLTAAYLKLGDVEAARGKLQAALDRYQKVEAMHVVRTRLFDRLPPELRSIHRRIAKIRRRAEQAEREKRARQRPPEPSLVERKLKREPATKIDQNVQFTVYRPERVRPERWYPLLAFAHLSSRRPGGRLEDPDPVEEVRRQAGKYLSEQSAPYGSVSQDSGQAVPQEGELVFVPQVPGIEFNPERRSFRWTDESVHREEFKLRASADLDGQPPARGRMSVYLGCILVAEISITIRVDGSAEPDALATPHGAETAHPYRKIFASYSHGDAALVKQFEEFAKAMGDRYLLDTMNLRAGEVWTEGLETLIREADVFQLFWSHKSMRSPFVKREWEYALKLPRSGFIRPVYWEDPLPSDPSEDLPPEDLSRLHFQRISKPSRDENEHARGTADRAMLSSASDCAVMGRSERPLLRDMSLRREGTTWTASGPVLTPADEEVDFSLRQLKRVQPPRVVIEGQGAGTAVRVQQSPAQTSASQSERDRPSRSSMPALFFVGIAVIGSIVVGTGFMSSWWLPGSLPWLVSGGVFLVLLVVHLSVFILRRSKRARSL